MENNQFIKVRTKNRTYYYFHDIIKLEDFDFDNILIDEKSYKNSLIYYISYKKLIDLKPWCIRFNKINGFIRIYDGTRYLTLFSSEKYDGIYNRIRYFISPKSSIKYVCSHYFAKVNYFDPLSIEKTLTLHNSVNILIKSVKNKDKKHRYYKIFFEKCMYQLTKK